MYRSLLLVVAILSVGITADDHFQYDITLFCMYKDRETFNFNIVWYEQDILNGEDEITQTKIVEAPVGRYSFTMDGSQNGDQWFSAGYESRAYIIHDCTDDRAQVKLQLTLEPLCEIGTVCHYRIFKDLTNTWGKEKMTAARREHTLEPFDDFP